MSLDRSVLAQDLPQYQESTVQARKDRYNAEVTQYNKEKAAYDAQVIKDEQKYQEDLKVYSQSVVDYEKYQADLFQYNKEKAAYDTQLAEYDRIINSLGGSATQAEYDAKKAALARSDAFSIKITAYEADVQAQIVILQEQKRVAMSQVAPMALRRSHRQVAIEKGKAAQIYDDKIRTLQFSIKNMAEAFNASERKITQQATDAERNRASSIKSAQSAAISARAAYAANPITFSSTIQNFGAGTTFGAVKPSAPMPAPMAQRIANVKPLAMPVGTTFPTAPTTVQRPSNLTGVKTGEYIYGGYWLANNPRAMIAGMNKPPVESKTPKSVLIQGVGIVQAPTPAILTLAEFQGQYKSTTKPTQSTLEGIILEKGQKIGSREKQIINLMKFKENELVTFERSATYTNPKTGKSFNAKTGMGDVTIGQQLGFVFDQNMQRPTTVDVKYAGSLEFVMRQNIPQKQIIPKQNWFESSIQATDTFIQENKNEPVSFLGGMGKEVVGVVGTTLNLIEYGGEKLNELSGLPNSPPARFNVPKSPIEYVFGLADEKKARSEQMELISSEGGYAYAGQIAGQVVTFIPDRIGAAGKGAIALVKGISKASVKKESATMEKIVQQYALERKAEGVFGIEKLGAKTFAITRGVEEVRTIAISQVKPQKVFGAYEQGKPAKMINTNIPDKVIIPPPDIEAKVPLTIIEFAKKGGATVTDFTAPNAPIPFDTAKVFIGSADPAFVSGAKTLGLKPIETQKNIFGKINPSTKKMVEIKTLETQGQLKLVAVGSSAPLNVARSGDIAEYVGSKAISTKIFETRGMGLGKAEFIIDVTKTREFIPVGSKDLTSALERAGLGTKRVYQPKTPYNYARLEKPTTGTGTGKAQVLTEQTKTTIKEIFTDPVQSIPKTSTTQPILIPKVPISGTTYDAPSSLSYSTEYETIRYPESQFKSIPIITQKSRLQTNTIQLQRIKQATNQQTILATQLETKLDVIQKQKTTLEQKYDSDIIQKQRQRTSLTSIQKVAPVQVLGIMPIQKQVQKQQPRQIQKEILVPKYPFRNRETKRTPVIIPLLKLEKIKSVKKKTSVGQKADFLGNVQESAIGGYYKRTETTYGQKRINKLLNAEYGTTRKATRKPKPDLFGFKGKKKSIF